MFDLAFFRTRPALEAMIEVFYAVAVDDVQNDVARAGFNLLEAIGRFDGSQATILQGWIAAFAHQTRRAIDEGDVIADVDPTHVASTLVSLYMGLRQTSDLNEPATFIRDLEAAWQLAMPGFVTPDRLPYLASFVGRRTALAIRNAGPDPTGNL